MCPVQLASLVAALPRQLEYSTFWSSFCVSRSALRTAALRFPWRQFLTHCTQSSKPNQPVNYTVKKAASSLDSSTRSSAHLVLLQNAQQKQQHAQHYKLIYQLNAFEYLLCTFSSTCFGLTRPSSGAMDVIISFTNAAYGVFGVVRCRSWGVCVLVVCCTATRHQHK